MNYSEVMKFDLIIPHKNQVNQLENTINAIKSQRPNLIPIIVDDGSRSNVKYTLSSIENISVIYTTHLNSPYKARNLGIAKGKNSNILLLDSKSIPENNYFNVVDSLIRSKEWDIVAGKITINCINRESHPIELFYALYYLKTDPVFYKGIVSPLTTNMLVKRKCFDELNGFKLSRSGNDTDFAQRARSRGFKILYEPLLRISYKKKSVSEVLSFLRRIAKNKNHVMSLLDARPPNPKDLNFRLDYIGLNLSIFGYMRLYFYIWFLRIYLYSHKTIL